MADRPAPKSWLFPASLVRPFGHRPRSVWLAWLVAVLVCLPAGALAQDAEDTVTVTDTPTVLLKTILGLLLLLGLAVLADNAKVRRLEEVLGISSAITAGFPFIILGALARLPGIGVLGPDVVVELTPLLHFGLGWLGFLVGFRFDVRFLEQLPSGTASYVALDTILPFVTTVLGVGGVMVAFGVPWDDRTLWRDALALGTAAAMAAPRAIAWLGRPAEGTAPERMRLADRVELLDEVVGVVGLLFLAAFFRPEGAAFKWQLPGTVWLFVTLGLGVTVGLVLYAVVSRPASGPDFLTLTLGSIAFAAGLAGYLWLSPVVVCFVAGAVVANLPGTGRDRVRPILERLERPIYLVFLAIVGALWDVTEWRGWVLVPAFVAARLVGKYIAAFSLSRSLPDRPPLHREPRFVIAPLSVLAIGVVVSMQILYQRGTSIPWIVTAVIGAAVVSEVLVQVVTRHPRARSDRPPAPASSEEEEERA